MAIVYDISFRQGLGPAHHDSQSPMCVPSSAYPPSDVPRGAAGMEGCCHRSTVDPLYRVGAPFRTRGLYVYARNPEIGKTKSPASVVRSTGIEP